MSESIERIDTSSVLPDVQPVVPAVDPPVDPPAIIPTAPVETSPEVVAPKEEVKVESEAKPSKRKPKTTTKREVKIIEPIVKVPDPSPERIEPSASPEKKTKVIQKPDKFDGERWKHFQNYHSISIRQIRGSIDSLNRQWNGSRTGR